MMKRANVAVCRFRGRRALAAAKAPGEGVRSARPVFSASVAGGLGLFLAWGVLAQEVSVVPENGSGVYEPGQAVSWVVEVKGVAVSEAAFVLKKGGLAEIDKGKVSLTDGKGRIQASLEEPGWLLVEVTAGTGEKPVKALGGALVSPEKIAPAQPCPDDFGAFWEEKLKELAAVPADPKLAAGDSGKDGIDYFRVTMSNIRGTKIQGQLARPKQGEKLPAMLVVQWAGVYGLSKDWVTGRAGQGWLVLNLNAHDLPIDQPEQFYKDQAAGPLKDYPSIGNDDREKSYFLRMYLSCHRGAQYLTERPDWDGKTLVVTGGSQGGLQSIVTAGLHPRITAVMAAVPAGCDLNGPVAGRLPGWPMWHWNTKDKDEAKVRGAARYYDVVNFAARVKCPVLVGIGLIDTVCPSPGIFAACSQLRGPKEMIVMPLGEHGEKNGSHRDYNQRVEAWGKALVKGEPAPLEPGVRKVVPK